LSGFGEPQLFIGIIEGDGALGAKNLRQVADIVNSFINRCLIILFSTVN
jgi:hypothetical protein